MRLMQGFVRQSPNFLWTKEPKMYRNINDGQFGIFYLLNAKKIELNAEILTHNDYPLSVDNSIVPGK